MTSWNIVVAGPQGAGVAGERELFPIFSLTSSWGAHIMWCILPGLLLLAAFVINPRDFLMLGPTALSLTFLSLLFVIALPIHSYRQLQLFAGLEMEPEPLISGKDGRTRSTTVHSYVRSVRRTRRPLRSRKRAGGKRTAVVALELELLKRLGARGSTDSLEGEDQRCEIVDIDVSELSPTEILELKRAYADLDLPMGASIEEVRRAYRRIMSIFHPDRFGHDQACQHMATELARLLASAYNRLIATLNSK